MHLHHCSGKLCQTKAVYSVHKACNHSYIICLPLVAFFQMSDEDSKLICVIGDEDTVTGFLLAGVGQRDASGNNFLVVDASTFSAVIHALSPLSQQYT